MQETDEHWMQQAFESAAQGLGRTSPNPMVGSVLVALWLRDLPGYGVGRTVAVGAAIAVASLAGDLLGSWTKRRAGIKDFSSVLPGQGGVIDRFNSFVAAMALVGYWL